MTESSNRTLGYALILLPLIPVSAAAETARNQEAIQNIYVSGTRSETRQAPLTTTVTVIDRQQIELSGARDLPDLLRTQAGIQVRDADGSGGRNVTLSMGGFGSNAANNTLVLVDGRKLNNPSLAGPALNSVALLDVERVEILQGSAGVLYGDQAVGGVINIITRRTQGRETRGYLEARRGSFDDKGYSFGLAQGIDNGLHYRLALHTGDAEHYRDNQDQDYRNYLGRIGYDFDAGRIYYEQQRVRDHLRLPGALSDEQLDEDRRQASTPDDFSDLDSRMARLGGEWQLATDWRLLVEFTEREDEAEGYSFGEFQQRTQVSTLTPRLIGHFGAPGGQATVTLGTDRQRAEYRRTSEFGDSDATQDLDANYGQLIYPLTGQLIASAGLRQETVNDTNVLEDQEREHQVNAREWGLSYRFSAAWRVYARSADGFRFANVDEYTFTEDQVEFLEPQQSRSTELGVSWRGTRYDIKAAYLRMQLDNEIVYDPGAGFGANVNLPESERRGALISADYRFNERWNGQINYTHTDATISEGSAAGNRVPFVARNLANLSVSYQPAEALDFYLGANYTGPRYRIDDNLNEQDELAGRVLWNANMVWRDEGWELGIRVINLTDEAYSDYQAWSEFTGNYEYPSPGRTVQGRLTYRF